MPSRQQRPDALQRGGLFLTGAGEVVYVLEAMRAHIVSMRCPQHG